MFKRGIWDKFTKFTFFKLEKYPEYKGDSKFQKMNEVKFPQISQIRMWLPVNHMWQALK